MDTDTVVLSAFSALLGAFLGYVFALRAARRQRLHEGKQQAYESMFPKIQESIDIMGEILAIEDLELEGGEKAQGQLVRLMRPLWVLGIDAGISELGGQLEGFTGKKPTVELLESVKNTVSAWLVIEFYGLVRDLRYDFAGLEFTPPAQDVKTKLDKVLSMMGGDELTLSLRSLVRGSGLS